VRLAFFTLLFLNLLYFAWAQWIDTPHAAPVNDAITHLPRLKLADEQSPTERPQPHTAQKTGLSEATTCLSVGPFGDPANSAQAAALLRDRGFEGRQRVEQGQVSAGYWVYIAGLTSLADADLALAALEQNGIKDARVMPKSGEAGPRLSLGLYSDRSRAERRVQAVGQAGLKAGIAERKLPGTLYWLDLTLPAGMATVPLQDLPAQGSNSRVAVQPCPPAAAALHEAATVSNPPLRAGGPSKLP
jgi:hypothetical protein